MIEAIRRHTPDWFDGPMRLAIGVGLVVGLLFVFVAPPWSGGADEASHFARSLDIAHGNLTPRTIDDGAVSAIPRSYRADQDLVVLDFEGPAPVNGTMIDSLLRSRPEWNDTVDYDTQSTTASSPAGYLPSAIGMMAPNAFGAPGVVVMWFGRLADLLFYLCIIGLAVHVAAAFRWTLAFGAIVPMNLALASAVTPDAVTISAIALVIAVFTRVWVRVSTVDPGDEGALRSIDVRTVLGVFASGVLLALAKPPYFLILLLFGVLAIVFRRHRTAIVAGIAAFGAVLVGGISTLVNVSSSYSGVAVSLGDGIEVQPDVQKQRLFDDPIGFLGRCARDWFSHLNDTVQIWSRRLGIWTSDPPHYVPWLLIFSFVLAAIVLDVDWLRRFRGLLRWSAAIGAVAMIVAIYASAYIWFDDTVDGQHMGDQIARYSLPLFPLAIMGWVPRWPIGPVGRLVAGRVERRSVGLALVGSALLFESIVVIAMLINWTSTGRARI